MTTLSIGYERFECTFRRMMVRRHTSSHEQPSLAVYVTAFSVLLKM